MAAVGSAAPETPAYAEEASNPPQSKSVSAAKGKSAHQSRKPQQRQVSLPVAILGSVLVAVFMHIWKKRPLYYVVRLGCACVGCSAWEVLLEAFAR